VDQRNLPLSGTYEPGGDGSGVHGFVIDTGIKNDPSGTELQLSPDGFSAHPGGTVDAEGHGTHVSGSFGSKSWGVAKGVTLHAVRALDENGSGSDSNVIRAVDWVTAWKLAHPTEPAVGNSSLGGGASPALDLAYCNSIDAGVTHVFAAGNETEDAKTSSPARVLQGITVGATRSDDKASFFSNYGPIVDVWAPGSGITSLMMGGGSTVMSGTSMASPHVAGAAALYLQRHPTAKPAEVLAGLIAQATDDKVTETGPGSTKRLLFVKEN
jgi:subtilisin family serine protease